MEGVILIPWFRQQMIKALTGQSCQCLQCQQSYLTPHQFNNININNSTSLVSTTTHPSENCSSSLEEGLIQMFIIKMTQMFNLSKMGPPLIFSSHQLLTLLSKFMSNSLLLLWPLSETAMTSWSALIIINLNKPRTWSTTIQMT